MATPSEEPLLVRYLLDECSEEEKLHVEERFFASDDTFDHLCDIEEELIARYDRGELSAEQAARFERVYSAPPRRERAVFHLALRRVVSSGAGRAEGLVQGEAVAQPPAWRRWLTLEPAAIRFGLAAAAVVLALALAVVMRTAGDLQSAVETAERRNQSLQQQVDAANERAARAERSVAEQNRDGSPSQLAQPDASPGPTPLVATFVLSPGLTRSARGPVRILVPREVDALRFQLDLDASADYARFRAELQTAAGEVVWGQDMLQSRVAASGRAVVVTVPAALVANGEHEFILHGSIPGGGVEDVAHYYFEVARR